jgi:hypothetical protein
LNVASPIARELMESSFANSLAACDSLIEGWPSCGYPSAIEAELFSSTVLNMDPLGGTEQPTSTSVHTLNLSGILCGGGGKVLARCRMTYQAGAGVTLELGVRAEQEAACSLVIGAI